MMLLWIILMIALMYEYILCSMMEFKLLAFNSDHEYIPWYLPVNLDMLFLCVEAKTHIISIVVTT